MHVLIVSSYCFRTGLLLQLIGCYSQYGGDGNSSIMLVIDCSLKGNVSCVITSRNVMAWLPYTLKPNWLPFVTWLVALPINSINSKHFHSLPSNY